MKAYTLLSSYAMAASILHDRVHAQNTPGVRALVKADRDLKDNGDAKYQYHGGSSRKASHGKGSFGKGGTKAPGGGSSRTKSSSSCKGVHHPCRSSDECCVEMQCVREGGAYGECAYPPDFCTSSPTGAPASDSPTSSPTAGPTAGPTSSPTDGPTSSPEETGWVECPAGLEFEKLEGRSNATTIASDAYANPVSAEWPFPPVNWFGRTLPSTFRISPYGQINIDPTDLTPIYITYNPGNTFPIGTYDMPRIAIAQGDLRPGKDGSDVRTLAKMSDGSITVSFENDVEVGRCCSSEAFINAQATIFPNGNVNLCFGNGTLVNGSRNETVAIGIEGPTFYPLPGLESTDGVTDSWDVVRNKCFCFAMPRRHPPTGSCCVGGSAPGCSDNTCQTAVCADDPSCCGKAWDALCAAKAKTQFCTDLCPLGPTPDP